MQKSWIEDFEQKYNKPQIEQITVGFSGIDPTPKYTGGSGEALADEVLKKLEELEIRIDSGNIDPDTPEPAPSPSPAPVIQTENDHEKLNNLLGGNSDGHYHLTEDELEKLQNMPAQGSQGADGKAATIHIGTVSAGSAGSTPRVTNTGTATDAVLNFVIPKGDKGDKGEQGIPGIQGNTGEAATIRIGTVTTGAAGSKPNVTNSGTENNAVLNFVIPKGDKGDTGAVGAKGDKGDTFNFEDLTEEQLETLKDKIGGGTGDHEELTNLQGGTDNEHYHIEEAQHHKLEILIKALFPTGTDDIYIPYIDDRDPDNPKVLPYTPFVDLPKGNPPEWKIAALPKGYYANPYTYPYYGAFPSTTYSNGLLVLLKNSATAQSPKYYFLNTTDLQTWESIIGYTTTATTYRGIVYLGNDWISTTSTKNIINLQDTTNLNNVYYGYGSFISFNDTTSTIMRLKTSSSVLAVCISPEMGILLVAGNNASGVATVQKKFKDISSFTVSKTINTFATTPNHATLNGLAWSPVHQVFCWCSTQGTATSSDGENWTVHNNAPKNLTDLTYREDLEVFFARSLDDKLFYASADGETWKNVTVTPIPLDTVACVDFCKETGIYCAVGGTSEFAYFSKDLSTWVPTKITNGANIEAGSVIYMPSTKKYVLFPTSGSYYYTFDPSAWTD